MTIQSSRLRAINAFDIDVEAKDVNKSQRSDDKTREGQACEEGSGSDCSLVNTKKMAEKQVFSNIYNHVRYQVLISITDALNIYTEHPHISDASSLAQSIREAPPTLHLHSLLQRPPPNTSP
jgi:hypothetical protein